MWCTSPATDREIVVQGPFTMKAGAVDRHPVIETPAASDPVPVNRSARLSDSRRR